MGRSGSGQDWTDLDWAPADRLFIVAWSQIALYVCVCVTLEWVPDISGKTYLSSSNRLAQACSYGSGESFES